MLASAGGMQGYGRFHPSETYVHEVLHLLALHTALQLALLSGVQPVAQCGQLHAISDRHAQCAACLRCRQTTMRPVSQAGPVGSCVTYMSIPLMLGVCDCGCRFNYRIGGERVEIGEAMVWRGVFAEMLMQVVSCCIQLRLARSLIMCCSPDFET